MNAALVINIPGNDARIKNFARFWLDYESSDVLWLVSGDGTSWCKLFATGVQGTPMQKDKRPTCVDCIFVHGSDFDSSMEKVRNQLTAGWTVGAGFIFNGPGDPPSKDNFIRILRPTADLFGLTSKHRTEIIDYLIELKKGSGGSPNLPSCFYPAAKHLVALDILAQGFLYAHGLIQAGNPVFSLDEERQIQFRELTSNSDWWTRGLGLGKVDELTQKLLDDKVPAEEAGKVVDFVRTFTQEPDYAKGTHPLRELRETICKLLQ